jgi:hypothetical protein
MFGAPHYGRKKAEELINQIQAQAEAKQALQLTVEDTIVLADMLFEMDKHLPDFFEED